MPPPPAIPTARTATISDAETLSRFAAAMFPLGAPADTDPADLNAYIATALTPRRFASYLKDPDRSIFLVEIDSNIAGYVMLARDHAHEMITAEHPIELQKLYVDPVFHGRGVAAALMRAALVEIDDPRHDAAWLSVHSENPRAVAFYKKWGFEIVGTHRFLVGSDPQKDYVMRRSRE